MTHTSVCPLSAALAKRWNERDLDPDHIEHCRSRFALSASPSVRTSILFLHGFNSAPGELFDQVARLAVGINAHLIAPCLPGHGSSNPASMRGIAPVHWIEAVDAACDDALGLAERLVVVGSSLGGSLAVELASRRRVDGLVLWSPGVRAVDEALLSQFCAAGDEVLQDSRQRTPGQEHWNRRAVHADGFRALRDMFTRYMVPSVFAQVVAPTWLGYYYRDQVNQDLSSRVDAMLSMWDQLATTPSLKHATAFPNGAHNLASPERSPASELVVQESLAFLTSLPA